MARLGLKASLWAILAALYAAAVFVAGSAPTPPSGPEYNDKVLHLLVFGGQYLLVSHARAAAGAPRTRQILAGALVALAIGAALEAWQSLLPYRSADFADLVADAAGVFLAALGEELVRRVRRMNARDSGTTSS
jgi:VanZ family protein